MATVSTNTTCITYIHDMTKGVYIPAIRFIVFEIALQMITDGNSAPVQAILNTSSLNMTLSLTSSS